LLHNDGRPFYAISEYMANAGIGVVYAVASDDDGILDFDSILKKDYSSLTWNIFFYNREKLVRKNITNFFDIWDGNRGYAKPNKIKWADTSVKETFTNMKKEELEAMVLNELFYSGYLKSVMKKPVGDSYDVDGFIISLSQRHILPIEIKEKFPVLGSRERFFGIDAGRIMMLLRMCIPNDSNGLYVVREVQEQDRKFTGWKYITLSKIIMSAAWVLQAGGVGMGGQSTQTVKIPYDEFESLTCESLEEENLQKISNLPDDVKDIATKYGSSLEKKFFIS